MLDVDTPEDLGPADRALDGRDGAPAHPRRRCGASVAQARAERLLAPPRSRACPRCAPGDDLAAPAGGRRAGGFAAGDVLVVAHKVVSKAEGRVRDLADGRAGRARPRAGGRAGQGPAAGAGGAGRVGRACCAPHHGVLICETRHGFVCANAGVDRSNTAGRRPGGAAARRPRRLGPRAARRPARARPAVVVADSFGRAWRLGQTDVALGAAGLVPLDDWRGRADARGRELGATEIAVADAVAGRGRPGPRQGRRRAGRGGARPGAVRDRGRRAGRGGAAAPARARTCSARRPLAAPAERARRPRRPRP